MVAQPNRLRMSVESYVTLDRNSTDVRYEFIDGYAYMMAGGTANHSTISINITSLLSNLLGNGPYRIYNSDMKVRLSESRYVYPDAEEYVLVNTQHEVIEVYRRARPNLWTLHLFESGTQVEFASINASFPITAIYRNVILPNEDLDYIYLLPG